MLELKNISKSFRDVVAVDNLNLKVENGEFFVILGPTGAGKTTTLRIVMGLERPDFGELYYDGENVTHLSPPLRNFAFMFESHNLYPILDVYDNLAFPLRSPLFKTPEDKIKRRVESIAAELHITHLLKRKVSHLSGGEQQRVALGRALIRKPRVYILDEPISSLDYKLREELQTDFKRIHEEYGITILSATHDNVSAMAMASRIGIMDKGRIIQVGPPRDVYVDPASIAVARIIGAPSMNILECYLAEEALLVKGNRALLIRIDPAISRSLKGKIGREDKVLIGVWPENILLLKNEKEGCLKAVVENIEYQGAEKFVNMILDGQPIKALLVGEFYPKHGSEILVFFPEEKLYFFSADTGMRIYL